MSMKIGSLIGIPIILHYTWFIAFILISWTLATWYMPNQYPGLSVLTYWTIGVVSSFLLLASVLIHEISHSYVAKKNNLPTKRIVLFIFGGVSQIAEEPANPAIEFKVSVVGPLTSFLLAAVFGIIWYPLNQMGINQAILAPFEYGAFINLLLGGFNLLPAFPLDGGRLLRAGMWRRTKNLVKATNIATKIGVLFSYLFMFAGFIFMVLGALVNGIWFILIGWFLKNGSESSMKQTVIGDALAGFTVGEVMTKDVHSITLDATVNEIVETFFKYKHGGFPVVENGELVGCVTIEDVKKVAKERWERTRAKKIMTARKKLILSNPEETVLDAMTKMSNHNIGRLPVIDEGKLVGIISRSDVMHIVKTKTELG